MDKIEKQKLRIAVLEAKLKDKQAEIKAMNDYACCRNTLDITTLRRMILRGEALTWGQTADLKKGVASIEDCIKKLGEYYEQSKTNNDPHEIKEGEIFYVVKSCHCGCCSVDVDVADELKRGYIDGLFSHRRMYDESYSSIEDAVKKVREHLEAETKRIKEEM